VLEGPNGQGKTNFLEACYLACTLRPLRAQKLSELIQFGRDTASVVGTFEMRGGERKIEVEVSHGKRLARLDGKPLRDPDELFNELAVVAFTPDDLSLVKAGPDGRRRLLDRAVQNRHPAQLSDARDYLRALKSRNELLRQGAPDAVREAFDEPLAISGAKLRLRREAVLRELVPFAERAFAQVARGEAQLQLGYQAAGSELGSIDAESELQLTQRLLAGLRSRLVRDRLRGFTSVGPHADDLSITLGDKPARAFASQGQARAIVLAFKIGELENLRARQGRAPLLLLDDVSSELDPERNAFLMNSLAALAGQVLLTTTDAQNLTRALREARREQGDVRHYQVKNGRLCST